MTDTQKDNRAENPDIDSNLEGAASARLAPDAEQVESAEASKPEISSAVTSSSEEFDKSKPSKPPVVLAKPAKNSADTSVKAEPAPVKVAMAPKPATINPAGSPVPDSSISIDEDRGPNVGALIIDAIAAAVAIAFTVLLVQDVIPFL
jgi:hypothetical protein